MKPSTNTSPNDIFESIFGKPCRFATENGNLKPNSNKDTDIQDEEGKYHYQFHLTKGSDIGTHYYLWINHPDFAWPKYKPEDIYDLIDQVIIRSNNTPIYGVSGKYLKFSLSYAKGYQNISKIAALSPGDFFLPLIFLPNFFIPINFMASGEIEIITHQEIPNLRINFNANYLDKKHRDSLVELQNKNCLSSFYLINQQLFNSISPNAKKQYEIIKKYHYGTDQNEYYLIRFTFSYWPV